MILPHNQGKSCRYFISCVQKHLELMFSVKMIQYVTLNKPKPALQIKRGSFYPLDELRETNEIKMKTILAK